MISSRYITAIFILLLHFFLAACSSNYGTAEEIRAYVQDPENGLHQVEEYNLNKVEITYRPVELLVWQDMQTGIYGDIEKVRARYMPYKYFILGLSRNNEEFIKSGMQNEKLYRDLIVGVAFETVNKTRIITSNHDTVPAIDAVFSRMYGTTGKNSVMLAFPSEDIMRSEKFQLEFDGRDWGLKYHTFHFNTKAIENIPRLESEK